MPDRPLKALLFDVFGTVVDWRRGVIEAARALAGRRGEDVDWGAFADAWRQEGYLEPIAQVVTGARPFTPVEELLGEVLPTLAARYRIGLKTNEFAELVSVWRRLPAWPDAKGGLERLRRRHLLAPLSNGSFAQLTEMAKRAGLPWDCVISTELFGAYKPDAATYRGALGLLDLDPDEVMLVAAHPIDLRAAAACGLRTAYVPRPEEWGPAARPPAPPDPGFDVVATDLEALAGTLDDPGFDWPARPETRR